MGKTVRPEALERFCVAALRAVGVEEGDASTTADVLVTTDTSGNLLPWDKPSAKLRKKDQGRGNRPGGKAGSRRRKCFIGGDGWSQRAGYGFLLQRDATGNPEGANRRDCLRGGEE